MTFGKKIKSYVVASLAAIVFVTTLSIVAVAQSTSTSSSNPQPYSTNPLQQQPATNDEAAPVYGFQGVLVETADGKVVAAQSIDETFNPASAIKLATALVALQNFGPSHRFTTGFWTDGALNKSTGELQGNLYVTGRDPSFHYEHAVMVARQLNNLGIRKVTGNLVIAPGFTMNFGASARRSGDSLYDTLDSTLRSTEAMRAWTYERTSLRDLQSLQINPSVAVMGEVGLGSVAPGARLLLTHNSSKLTDVLKVLLCYSNNFMAERIGDSLGGTQAVENQLSVRLGIPAEEMHFASLSGLGVNRVTPRAMMKILRGLRAELLKHRLSPSDIMPVAGIDPGTLEDRFTGPAWQGSVIAKTGTLIRTDGGASALVGQMRTGSGDVLLFVIMNQRGSVVRFRQNQDLLVMQIQNSRGGPKAFKYTPLILPMRLADTESISGSQGLVTNPTLKTVGP